MGFLRYHSYMLKGMIFMPVITYLLSIAETNLLCLDQ